MRISKVTRSSLFKDKQYQLFDWFNYPFIHSFIHSFIPNIVSVILRWSVHLSMISWSFFVPSHRLFHHITTVELMVNVERGIILLKWLSSIFGKNLAEPWIEPQPPVVKSWPRAYKNFFMLNSAEHEISKLDKSNLINLLERVLTCFCLSKL